MSIRKQLSEVIESQGIVLTDAVSEKLTILSDLLESTKRQEKFSDDMLEVVKSSGFKHTYHVHSDEFEFKRDIGFFPTTEEIRKKHSLPNLPGTQRKDFRPTKAELNKINSEFAARELKQDEIKVFPVVLWGSDYDSHLEKFSLKATKEGRKLAPGAPGIEDHDDFNSSGVHAKLFEAEVFQEGANYWLVGKAFVPDTAEHKSYIDGIEFGINDNLSVGVRSKRGDYICDVCEKPMYKWSEDASKIWCGHYTGQMISEKKTVTATIDGISRFKEFSRVVAGAQICAGFNKSDSDPSDEINSAKGIDPGATLPPVSGKEEFDVDELKKMLQEYSAKMDEKFGVVTELAESVKELKTQVDELAKEKESTENTPAPAPAANPAEAVTQKQDAEPAPAAAAPAPVVAPATTDVQKTEDRMKLLEDLQAANIASQKALEAHVAENKEMLKTMATAFTGLVEQTNALQKTSQEDVLLALASMRDQGKTASQAEAELAKKDGFGFGGIISELTKMGEKK